MTKTRKVAEKTAERRKCLIFNIVEMGKTEPVNVNSVNRIAEGTTFRGEIMSSSDIRIDGNFDGKILCKGKIVIGEKADVRGHIICNNLDLDGTMSGVLYVADTLSLKSNSSMSGEIYLNLKRLYVEVGSTFNGSCRMVEEGEFKKLVAEIFPGENKTELKPANGKAE